MFLRVISRRSVAVGAMERTYKRAGTLGEVPAFLTENNHRKIEVLHIAPHGINP